MASRYIIEQSRSVQYDEQHEPPENRDPTDHRWAAIRSEGRTGREAVSYTHLQALGWREGQRYLPLQDDIASVAFWYQTLPTVPFAPLADKDYLEVI